MSGISLRIDIFGVPHHYASDFAIFACKALLNLSGEKALGIYTKIWLLKVNMEWLKQPIVNMASACQLINLAKS
jgi:hypothetical protein